jgi:hypothetical protein
MRLHELRGGTLRNLNSLCWGIIVVNGIAGPIIKFGIGYENVPWVLVGPRMIFTLAAAAVLVGLFLHEQFGPAPQDVT